MNTRDTECIIGELEYQIENVKNEMDEIEHNEFLKGDWSNPYELSKSQEIASERYDTLEEILIRLKSALSDLNEILELENE